MAVAKRLFLFFGVNMLILVTISITMNLLGVQPYLTARGINYTSLLIFCLIWGMGFSMASLALSRIVAKRTMGIRVIDPQTGDAGARDLVNMVHNLARAASLPKMPEVGVYNSPEVNAFATGPTRSRSLVAVSSGLLEKMDRRELEGVLGHEIAHIANGDMVTMTLIQGIINAFVMFFARVAAFFIVSMLRGDRDGGGWGLRMLITIVLEIALSILGFIVVAFFSRMREFRADKGSAQLAGRDSMISALEALGRTTRLVDTRQQSLATLKIAGGKGGGIRALMSTHPPLERRIERLRRMG
ncbi:MAG: protease HtpX [bacterium]|nr:protease HtpX [bacterium]